MATTDELIGLMITRAESCTRTPPVGLRKVKTLYKEGGAEAVMSHPSAPLWLFWYNKVIEDVNRLEVEVMQEGYLPPPLLKPPPPMPPVRKVWP